MRRQFLVSTLTLFVAMLLFGCNQSRGSTRQKVDDFPTLEAKSWVNGSPVSLAEMRGKHVVLIEAWHPS